jgi:hypothetical protein
VRCKCQCGKSFRKYDKTNRLREFFPSHNNQPQPTTDAILRVLLTPLHVKEIARFADKSFHATSVCLSKMKKRGLVRNDGRGIWSPSA